MLLVFKIDQSICTQSSDSSLMQPFVNQCVPTKGPSCRSAVVLTPQTKITACKTNTNQLVIIQQTRRTIERHPPKSGMPEYRSSPQYTAVHFCRQQKRTKIHGKVVAKTALVLKYVDKWFLVLFRPYSRRTALKRGRLRWTAVFRHSPPGVNKKLS